jgi:uncharacterized protein with PIN domain
MSEVEHISAILERYFDVLDKRVKERSNATVMNCPECNEPMQNLGCRDGKVYETEPPTWDETWVCDNCKIKKKRRVHSQMFPRRNLDEYREA